MKIPKILIASVIAVALLCSCSSNHKSYLKGKLGKPCTVQFKRNALGGASLPVLPTTNTINGAVVSISGTLKKIDKDAVIISDGTTTYWIPKDSILLIQID